MWIVLGILSWVVTLFCLGFCCLGGGVCPQVEITVSCPDLCPCISSNKITQVQHALGGRHAERTLPLP